MEKEKQSKTEDVLLYRPVLLVEGMCMLETDRDIFFPYSTNCFRTQIECAAQMHIQLMPEPSDYHHYHILNGLF